MRRAVRPGGLGLYPEQAPGTRAGLVAPGPPTRDRPLRDTRQGLSQENVETTRELLDAFDRHDKRAWLTMADPDAEMVPAQKWPESAPIRGGEAIWDFYVEVTSFWGEGSTQLGEVIDAGRDKIVANNRRDARGRT